MSPSPTPLVTRSASSSASALASSPLASSSSTTAHAPSRSTSSPAKSLHTRRQGSSKTDSHQGKRKSQDGRGGMHLPSLALLHATTSVGGHASSPISPTLSHSHSHPLPHRFPTQNLDDVSGHILPHSLPPHVKRAMDDVLKLFACQPSLEIFERWSEKAEFEDPFTKCKSLKEINAQWFAMPSLFSSKQLCEPRIVHADSHELAWEQELEYTVKLGGIVKVVHSKVVLRFEDGKIVRMEDRWDGKEFSKFSSPFRRFQAHLVALLVSVPKVVKSAQTAKAEENNVGSGTMALPPVLEGETPVGSGKDGEVIGGSKL